MKFSVLGAGSWGTTLANLLAENGNQVRIWARETEIVDGINNDHRNPVFVDHLQIHSSVSASNSIPEVLEEADFILTAIPSGFLSSVLQPYSRELLQARGIVNVAKGFQRNTGKRLSQVILEVLGIEENSPEDMVACLSGPNLADEIAKGKIGASVVACSNEEIAEKLQNCLSNNTFRVYRQTDRTGVELGGTLKNIFCHRGWNCRRS